MRQRRLDTETHPDTERRRHSWVAAHTVYRLPASRQVRTAAEILRLPDYLLL